MRIRIQPEMTPVRPCNYARFNKKMIFLRVLLTGFRWRITACLGFRACGVASPGPILNPANSSCCETPMNNPTPPTLNPKPLNT